MTKDVAGGGGQDERVARHSGWATGEASAIGRYEPSAVFWCEEHAVEDVAGGIGGGAVGDVGQALQGGRGDFRGGSLC